MIKKLLLKLIQPKIDWSKAPKWANFYSIDGYGNAVHWSGKPSLDALNLIFYCRGKCLFRHKVIGKSSNWWYRLWWRYSLQERPR